MLKSLLPITIILMLLILGCNETNGTDKVKENNNKEWMPDGEFWKEVSWDVKKITLLSLKNGVSVSETKDVLNLYYKNYDKWEFPEYTDINDEYEKWINQEINNISSKTSLTTQEVARIIWEWEEECEEVYY